MPVTIIKVDRDGHKDFKFLGQEFVPEVDMTGLTKDERCLLSLFSVPRDAVACPKCMLLDFQALVAVEYIEHTGSQVYRTTERGFKALKNGDFNVGLPEAPADTVDGSDEVNVSTGIDG